MKKTLNLVVGIDIRAQCQVASFVAEDLDSSRFHLTGFGND